MSLFNLHLYLHYSQILKEVPTQQLQLMLLAENKDDKVVTFCFYLRYSIEDCCE
jgi:hypothetical protein